MPFDDSNIRKLVRCQLEKKIHFSRYKPLSIECKQLILLLLEPDVKLRATIIQIINSDWIKGSNSSTLNSNSAPSTSLSTIGKSSATTAKIFYPLVNTVQDSTVTDNYQLPTKYRKNSFDQIINNSLTVTTAIAKD